MLNADYLIRREQQELEAALKASNAGVRRLHLAMANAYTSRIEQIRRQDDCPPADLLEQT